MQENEKLVEPNLTAMRGMVGTRVRAHTCALLELQVIQYKLTQWLIWWRVNEWNLWKMWRYKSTWLLQWIGARLNSLHRRELERLYSESRRAVAWLYHPDDHDCPALTGPHALINCGYIVALGFWGLHSGVSYA